MWLLVGEIRRVLARAGDKIEGNTHQVQLLATEALKNGEIRENLYTLGTTQPFRYEPFIGKTVVLEASPFARKDGGLGVMLAPDSEVREFEPVPRTQTNPKPDPKTEAKTDPISKPPPPLQGR